MSDLDRDSERSLTRQLVDVVAGAIESGELEPGEKLPPTRELAALAGVNHLTAVRAYRKLRELGLVSAQVGRGTFVRGRGRPDAGAAVPDSISWQRYALPEYDETYADRVLSEMHNHVAAEGLIALSVGYPSRLLFPVEELREASDAVLREQPGRALQYSDIQGVPELAEELARLSAHRGAPEDPRDIVITNGASQGLSLTMRALINPGDAVACEDPTFMSVIRAVRSVGARVVPIPVDLDGLDVDALEELLAREEIKALVLQPRLHNPTGRDLSPERRARLLTLARRHGFFVVEDGIYGDLRFEGEDPGSLRAEAPAHVIYCDSLSKTVAGGLRAGWVAASGPVLERIVAEKRSDDIHSNTFSQLVVAHYLASGAYPAQAERARRFYAERCEVMIESIERHLGAAASFTPPLGGGHIWLTLEMPLDERELIDEAMRQGVACVPGQAMSFSRRRDVTLRLSFAYLEPEELDEGIRRLASAARAVRRRPARSSVAPV